MAQFLEETDDILKDLELSSDLKFEKLSVVFDVDFVDTNFLEVDFGANLKLKDVQIQPDIKLPNIKDAQFLTFVMLDPDAPSRQKPTAKVRIYEEE